MLYMVNITIQMWNVNNLGDMIKKLEALETWFYRRILRISWKEKVTNVEVYRRMNTSTSLLIDIVHRPLTFLGHILRKGEVENLVVTGFVDGKRDRGRQRETFLNYLSKIVGKSLLELITWRRREMSGRSSVYIAIYVYGYDTQWWWCKIRLYFVPRFMGCQ